MWQIKQHWVYEHRLLLGIETSEHAAHIRDFHITLVKHGLLLHQQHVVRDSCVHVRLSVVIQAHHVAFGDKVEQNRCQEGEEADKTTERSLQRKAAQTDSRLCEDEGHQAQAKHAAGVREKLHTCKSNTIVKKAAVTQYDIVKRTNNSRHILNNHRQPANNQQRHWQCLKASCQVLL